MENENLSVRCARVGVALFPPGMYTSLRVKKQKEKKNTSSTSVELMLCIKIERPACRKQTRLHVELVQQQTWYTRTFVVGATRVHCPRRTRPSPGLRRRDDEFANSGFLQHLGGQR